MDEVTVMLHAAEQGDVESAHKLLALVYEELRRRAAVLLNGQKWGPKDSASLVSDVYLKLFGKNVAHWNDRAHFFATAAKAMREILVDEARGRHAKRRGGGRRRADVNPDDLAAKADAELLALDVALERLAKDHPDVAKLVQLRYFAGQTIEDAAAALGIAPRTADKKWAFAKSKLRKLMDLDDAAGT
jgi:RNA polymerase sigma factor (TIGR02999 family)